MAQSEQSYRYTNGMCSCPVVGIIVLPLSPEGQFDCGRAYKGFWQRLEHKYAEYAELSAEQLVALTRRALRVYDVGQTHDLAMPMPRPCSTG
jgi:hypothetical protein